MVYLDHNATTPMRPEVVDAVARACVDLAGNPSSIHAAGRRARAAVETARAQVADLLGVTAEEIVFTSGGTEGDNLAIRGLGAAARARGRRHVVTSPLEHPAVRGAVAALVDSGSVVTVLPVASDGAIAEDDLVRALGDDTGLVTLALANHEMGNVYPIARFAARARAQGALTHTDAVQAAGKMLLVLGPNGIDVDAATISAHKIGGPMGIGAVFIRRGVDLPPLLAGGHQERERRPGTENVPAIVGFGVACARAAAALVGQAARLSALRTRLEHGLLRVAGARILGDARADHRLPGTTMVAAAGAPGQLVAIGLDLDGICVSTGAACTSGSLEPSPVLLALGLSADAAAEGLRISLGWTTTTDDVDVLIAAWPAIVERVRKAMGNPRFAPTASLESAAHAAPAAHAGAGWGADATAVSDGPSSREAP